VLLLSCAAGLLVALGGGAALATSGEGVPPGTRVRAVDIGGLSEAEAVARLESAFATERTSSISLVADGEVLQLDPVKAGIDLDEQATVDRALEAGRLDRLMARLGSGRDVDPVPSYDADRLRAELTRLKKGFDREPREGAVRFSPEGEPVAAPPLTGRSLDVDGTVRALQASYLSARVDAAADITAVSTTAQDVQEAMDEVAVPAVAAPISVDVEGDRLVVEPLDIAKALRLEATDGEIEPRLDAAVLHERVSGKLRKVGTPAVDATFDVSTGTPVVVPSKTGMSVSADDLAEAVMDVLTDPEPRKASAPLTVSQPRVSTEVAKGLGVREVIGTFTTRHPCCRPRVENIHRIADIVDGYVLRPGDRFDLNGYVGPRDKARGFKEAPQILEGQFVDRVGGGVSQFATTIFNAVFFSGLKDITHTPHSYYISRYPPGREATVSFPLPDLIFENDSPHGVLIKTSYTGTSITVTFWGTKRYDDVRSITGPRTRLRDFGTEYVDRDDCTATEGEKGFDIVVTRVFEDGGREVKRESFKTRYKPEPRFICGKAPRGRRSSSPAPTGG
jgi:vancomycin resistance protein YoaR